MSMTPLAARYDLVIFDCDGVLVDSELISAKVLTAQLAAIDIDLSSEDFRKYFLGKKFSFAVTQLADRTQIKIPEDFQERYFERLLNLFQTELQAMSGVEQILKSMAVDFCVASSSIPPRLDCALKVTGLQRYFGNHVYSAALVKNAKPAPDLFLHAANAHHVHPKRCLVIEDSEMGVLAANAADMDVWHFTGGAHIDTDVVLPENVRVERVAGDMSELYQLFRQLGLCHGAIETPNSGAQFHGA